MIKNSKEVTKEKTINLICGHFEGVDERVLSSRNIEEISIGDYILSGGESASFVIIDAVLRLLPGVLGNVNSKNEESFENGFIRIPAIYKTSNLGKKKCTKSLIIR